MLYTVPRVPYPNEGTGGVLITLSQVFQPVGGYTYDAWSGHHQTYSHLPSLGVSPPFDRYQIILLVDRGTRV